MGFLGFKTDAEKKAENDAMRKRAQENADKQYAKDAAAMSGAAPTPPTPPTQPVAPASVSATAASQTDLLKTGAGAITKPSAADELKKLKNEGYKDGGVISSDEKKLLKQKAMVKQKRGC